MAYTNARSVRFHDDVEFGKLPKANGDNLIKIKYNVAGKRVGEPSPNRGEKPLDNSGKSLKAKVLCRFFSEDYDRVKKKILDPRGHAIHSKMEQDFLDIHTVSNCIRCSIFSCFRQSPPSSSGVDLGPGIVPKLRGSTMRNTKNVLRFIIIFQYIPRLFLIFPLSSQIVKATGVVTETPWAGAAYNLMLFMLASHILGKKVVGDMFAIWRVHLAGQSIYFDCKQVLDSQRKAWFQSSNITKQCNPDNGLYPFGIYGDAREVLLAKFFNKYLNCLKNLSLLQVLMLEK